MHYPTNTVNRLTVNKLLLQETGTYNPLHFRPYQTHIDGQTLDTIVARAESSVGSISNPSIFSGISSSVVSPSGTPGQQISIPYGWAERRIRFILELSLENNFNGVELLYFQGYTNYSGVTMSGAVDPMMEFILNSYMRVTRTTMYTANGLQYVDRVTDSGQVINGMLMTENVSMVTPGYEHGVYTLRPQDVFVGISSIQVTEQYEAYGRGAINDSRVAKTSDTQLSSRTNNIPTNYISKILGSYQTAADSQMYGHDTKNTINRAHEVSFEHDSRTKDNPFIRALSVCRGGGPNSLRAVFTARELESIDPMLSQKTQYVALTPVARSFLPQIGQAAHWSASDRETVLATMLSTSVPALMMELMISKIHVRTTNNTIGAKFETFIIDAKSISNADMSKMYGIFIQRLERELLFDMTFGSQEIVMLDMMLDMMGESSINISVNGSPTVLYQTPSFCDSLLAPVTTTSKDNYFQLCNDFGMIFNNMSSAVSDLTNISGGI